MGPPSFVRLQWVRERFRMKPDDYNNPIIPTPRGGHVYQHGEWTLGIYVVSGYPTRSFQALKAKIPGLREHQIGDGEAIFTADYTDERGMVAILRAAKARYRRQPSDEVKARLRAQGRRTRFRPGHGAQDTTSAPESTNEV